MHDTTIQHNTFMAKQQNPENHPVTSAVGTPDKASAEPTGEELYTSGTSASRPSRDTDQLWPGAWGQTENVQGLQQMATEYYRRLSATAGELADQARSLYQEGEGYVKEHPGGSLLGAAALGLLIGFLIDRD